MTEHPDVRDGRTPFCYTTLPALAAIRAHYEGDSRLTSALGIYLCFAEIANAYGGAPARVNGFKAARKRIAAYAGVSVDTVDRYTADFETIGILQVIRGVDDAGGNLPNVYVLVDTPGTEAPIPGRTGAAMDGRTGAAVNKQQSSSKQLESFPPITPHGETRPATVNRRPVTDDEWQATTAILHEWNGQTGSQLATKGTWATKLVMRIREHPDLTLQDHAAIIAANLADPWWKGAASPSVVYGSAEQFERSMLVAAAAPGDTRRNITPDEMRSYGTLWGPGTGYATLAEARAAGSHPVIEAR